MKSCVERGWKLAVLLLALSVTVHAEIAEHRYVAASVDEAAVQANKKNEAATGNLLKVMADLPDIKELRPPIKELSPNPWMVALLWLGGVAVVIVSVVLGWRHYCRKAGGLQALKALRVLRESEILEAGEIMTYYRRLNRILRKYIHNCYAMRLCGWMGLLAGGESRRGSTEDLCRLSRTNRELIARLHAWQVETVQIDAISQVLIECDLVKFANQRPKPESARAALAVAVEFVEGTRAARAVGGWQ